MNSKEFIIWLKGYLDGNGDKGLTTMQVRDLINKIDEIEDHQITQIKPTYIEIPEKREFPGHPPEIYF